MGKTLSQKLIDVRDAARPAEHYYIGLRSNVRNPNFKNEKPYAQMNYADDSGMRLLALFRYWNMIEYFFPYKHLTDNVPTMITGIGVYYPDGREIQRVGIAIDVEVKPTIQGIIDGKDELLEKALEIIFQ